MVALQHLLLFLGTLVVLAERVTDGDVADSEESLHGPMAAGSEGSLLGVDMQSHMVQLQQLQQILEGQKFFPSLMAAIHGLSGASASAASASVASGAATSAATASAASAAAAGGAAASAASASAAAGTASTAAAASAAAASHAAASAAVATQVGGPAMFLSGMTGGVLSVSAVSALTTAGAIAGPIIGLAALAVICIQAVKDPEDPWTKMEEMVAEQIDGRFNKERKKRLGNRMKRYTREMTLCTASWISQVTPHSGSHVIASMLQASPLGSSFLEDLGFEYHEFHRQAQAMPAIRSTDKSASPPCLEQLQMHMSLERDEWMIDEGDSLDALFVPFSVLHTQILHFLTDYPPAGSFVDWEEARKQASAEYADFIFRKLHDAWVSQSCRSVRLREASGGMFSKAMVYELTALLPEFQPNAGQNCWDKCGKKTGWCNWCGGRDLGACCKKDDVNTRSECKTMDIPQVKQLLGMGKMKHVCVHADCQQEDTKYTKNIKKGEGDETPENITRHKNIFSKALDVVVGEDLAYETEDWLTCQNWCQARADCKTWTWYKKKRTCKLQDGTGIREVKEGAVSGPKKCPKNDAEPAADEKKELEEEAQQEDKPTQTKEEQQDMLSTPTQEQHPCNWSEPASWETFYNVMDPYVKHCYKHVMKAAGSNFNKFYARFAETFDQLAGAAGCDETKDEAEKDVDVWNQISEDAFGQWKDCGWDEQMKKNEEQKKKDKHTWVPEPSMPKDGSKVTFAKQKLLRDFPAPVWLARRKALRPCLDKAQITKAADVVDTLTGVASQNAGKRDEKEAEKEESPEEQAEDLALQEESPSEQAEDLALQKEESLEGQLEASATDPFEKTPHFEKNMLVSQVRHSSPVVSQVHHSAPEAASDNLLTTLTEAK
eukprot:CAMPEP_0197643604 /NCGR_PEP_ID=MMETSP1338-20131121/16865_1 /TAXON_ID=43686 ORGANISM="Pelagodinium beii, Strain RCC1491" /NCGR_SAMPLE_ID=MMETSP1338 /ASSEMBLY_ACC=CAM_ASM_000754 /LENGTH=889 /DNA_ID=CAMNT_0043216877 /DNA_START=1 /DNA_END=2670 /DNA_ORIENTATION=+